MINFSEINKKFWSKFPAKQGAGKLLLEEPNNDSIDHANAVYALILNQAQGYTPVWLYSAFCHPIELLRSYVATAETRKIYQISIFGYVYITLTSILIYIKTLFTRNILAITYDGVRYGDIIYDTYLANNSVATVRKIDYKFIRVIASIIARHIRIKKILFSDNYKGVLVSHQVSISSGVMLRVALRHGFKGFLRAGHHQSTFQCFRKLEEVYDYEHKPFPEDVDKVTQVLGQGLEQEFQKELAHQISGNGDRDAAEAFVESSALYNSRADFNKEYKVDSNKKNIFVLMHAFNDYPHSHFRWMIFKDYYDWFKKTLDFAKQNKSVNWIFKQHPSIRYYRTTDVNFDELFSNLPENVIYISEEKQIDTRSLVTCADMVITCLGSAGFELPAMGAVPSLIAGDSFYTGLGFAIEPTTAKEYFAVLEKAHSIEKLTKLVQDRAKAAYIFIYRVSRPNLTACPILSSAEEKDPNMRQWYWDRVAEQYALKKDVIYNEAVRYIGEIQKPNFKRLINL